MNANQKGFRRNDQILKLQEHRQYKKVQITKFKVSRKWWDFILDIWYSFHLWLENTGHFVVQKSKLQVKIHKALQYKRYSVSSLTQWSHCLSGILWGNHCGVWSHHYSLNTHLICWFCCLFNSQNVTKTIVHPFKYSKPP